MRVCLRGDGVAIHDLLFFIARPLRDILAPITKVTPLVLEEFPRELAEFSSRKRNYVSNGLQFGFRVG